MLLSTVSLMLLYGCQHTVEDFIRIDDYEFCSLTELGKEIKKPNDVDVIANIRDSKRIKGPVIGYCVKLLRLVNKGNAKDTLSVIVYGKDNRYFRIDNEYYEAKKSIFSNDINNNKTKIGKGEEYDAKSEEEILIVAPPPLYQRAKIIFFPFLIYTCPFCGFITSLPFKS